MKIKQFQNLLCTLSLWLKTTSFTPNYYCHATFLRKLTSSTIGMRLIEDELIVRCSAGDARAQQSLYQQFSPKMFGVCLRYTGSREEAEDVLQEGFIKIFHSITTFKGLGPLENWMKKIMVNTALDHYRQQKTRIDETELFENAGEPVEPLQQFHARELLKIIQKIPTGYRTVFNLYAVEGYNHKEIGALLNITEGTSKSQYARAKTHLARIINLSTEQVNGSEIRTVDLVIAPSV